MLSQPNCMQEAFYAIYGQRLWASPPTSPRTFLLAQTLSTSLPLNYQPYQPYQP